MIVNRLINIVLAAVSISSYVASPSLPLSDRRLTRRQSGNCSPWKEDFSSGMGSFIPEGQASVIGGNLVMKISLGNTPNPTTKVIMGYGSKVQSTNKVLYGTTTARIKTSRMGGVVCAFILLSPEKDEIDWEWVGKEEFTTQTNYYSKGVLDYTKGLYIPNGFNTHSAFHDYTVKWTENEIVWLIDNVPVRTLTKAQAGSNFPNTAANIYFSLWDGGSNVEGTRNWAGGLINWKDTEYLQKGYMSAEIDFVSYTC